MFERIKKHIYAIEDMNENVRSLYVNGMKKIKIGASVGIDAKRLNVQ